MLVIKSTSLESESESESEDVSPDVSICFIPAASDRCDIFGWRQAFAKWFRLPQFRHLEPQAGHFSFLNACSPPQNLHPFRLGFPSRLRVSRVLRLLGGLPRGSRCPTLLTSSVVGPEIAWSCELVASELLHRSMHLMIFDFFRLWRDWRDLIRPQSSLLSPINI